MWESKNALKRKFQGVFGTAEGIRTPDLLVRSQTLYPAELQPHTVSHWVSPRDSLIILPYSFTKCKHFF